MTGVTWIVVILAALLLIAGLAYTLEGFRHRARDPEHRRRLGDRIRSKRG